MSSSSRARLRGALRAFTAAVPCVLLLSLPAGSGSPGEATLAIVSWDQPTASALDPFREEGRLLAHNEDFAVLTLPPGAAPAGGVVEIEAMRAVGAYFLFLSESAQAARFDSPAEVLHRRGHTTLLWTPGDAPRPAVGSTQRGLQQLQRITRAAKPWPAHPEETDSAPRATTVFAPEVDHLVNEIEEVEYVSVWQSLDDFETRYTLTAENDAAASWMYSLLSSYGLQVGYFVHNQSGPRKNVIATHPGSVDPSRVVYMTGHFDSVSEDPTNHAPGADDNGSGTAAFLEAARVLSQYDFEYTIKFAAFNGEEQGLVGASAYVEHIFAEGEDVIGCFNLDMIAYRGTDPAPPDLVIYTDTASQSLAEILRDAAEYYLPNDLEPRIVQQALGASDHAAFWQYGYRAILGIEENAWGSDFCPWYHTSNDRIEMYPTDFPTHITKATVAAVAQSAIPVPAVGAPIASLGSGLRLHSAFPNPSSGPTTLRFDVPVRQNVRLSLYDLSGRRVKTLLNEAAAEGNREVVWSGRDEGGRPVVSGVYWVRLETEEGVLSSRLTRLR